RSFSGLPGGRPSVRTSPALWLRTPGEPARRSSGSSAPFLAGPLRVAAAWIFQPSIFSFCMLPGCLTSHPGSYWLAGIFLRRLRYRDRDTHAAGDIRRWPNSQNAVVAGSRLDQLVGIVRGACGELLRPQVEILPFVSRLGQLFSRELDEDHRIDSRQIGTDAGLARSLPVRRLRL